eukprot:7383291-Prymnesium_polylepis.4
MRSLVPLVAASSDRYPPPLTVPPVSVSNIAVLFHPKLIVKASAWKHVDSSATALKLSFVVARMYSSSGDSSRRLGIGNDAREMVRVTIALLDPRKLVTCSQTTNESPPASSACASVTSAACAEFACVSVVETW